MSALAVADLPETTGGIMPCGCEWEIVAPYYGWTDALGGRSYVVAKATRFTKRCAKHAPKKRRVKAKPRPARGVGAFRVADGATRKRQEAAYALAMGRPWSDPAPHLADFGGPVRPEPPELEDVAPRSSSHRKAEIRSTNEEAQRVYWREYDEIYRSSLEAFKQTSGYAAYSEAHALWARRRAQFEYTGRPRRRYDGTGRKMKVTPEMQLAEIVPGFAKAHAEMLPETAVA